MSEAALPVATDHAGRLRHPGGLPALGRVGGRGMRGARTGLAYGVLAGDQPARELAASLSARRCSTARGSCLVCRRRAMQGRRTEEERVELVATDLHLASLSSVQLPGADLRRANLHEAWLRDSCLHGADLRDAHLEGADLDAADLRGADLDGADLRGSTFSRVTAWPAGFDPVAAGAGRRVPSRTI